MIAQAQMRILFVTPAISWPLSFGGDIRKWHVLQGLRGAGSSVDALVFRKNESPVSKQAFDGCTNVFERLPLELTLSRRDAARFDTAWGRGWLALSRVRPFEYLLNADVGNASRRDPQPRFEEYDLIWICTGQLAARLALPRQIPAIVDGDDFSYVRNWHLLRNSPWYGAKIWNYLNLAKLWWHERGLASHYTAVVRCSTEDRLRHPADNVHVIPNGATIPAEVSRHPGRSILFVGDLGYEPNVQGLRWFIDSIWPLVHAAAPDATLEIAGRLAPPEILAANGKAGVSVLGFVDDLGALYARCACSVVPLLAGGGTRLKVLESLARATPVVATTLGAFGIPAGTGEGLHRVDEPAQFAACCASHLANPHSHQLLAAAGRQFVKSHYDWSIIGEQVKSLAVRIGRGSGEKAVSGT